MTTCSVYWIRTSNHSDIFADGYVGVSKDVSKRWNYGHKGAHKNNRHDNVILSNAIAKYGWENLIKEIVLIADVDYCYDIEKKLRPTELIGWNIAVGGFKPPASKSRGANYVSPLKGVPRPTPWLVGRVKPMPKDFFSKGGKAGKGRKQTPEQIAKRVASRRATLAAQGRTH
jgi:hypothetical protein